MNLSRLTDKFFLHPDAEALDLDKDDCQKIFEEDFIDKVNDGKSPDASAISAKYLHH